jgi:P27 family predicted phage terminase small subunit
MGKRGPKPAGSQNMRVLDPPKTRRPNPLPGMSPPARTVWKRIVHQFPHDHFRPHHFDQLRAYCEASAIHKEARDELNKTGLLIEQPNGVTKESPYVGIMDKMAGRMQGLAVKLGITKNATLNRDPKEQPEEKPSGRLKFGR